MLRVQFTVSRVLCVLFQRSIPLYSPVPVPLEPPNLPLSQIGIPYSSGSAVRVCYVCMYETNNNKTIYTIHIFFGFAFWKLKVRTKLGDTKGGVEKCFQSRVKSQLSTTVHSLPGGTPTHPLLWTSLASQTPRTYGTLSSPRGGRLGFHEAQTICQTLILWKKAAHNGRLRLRCFAKLFYCPQNIRPIQIISFQIVLTRIVPTLDLC